MDVTCSSFFERSNLVSKTGIKKLSLSLSVTTKFKFIWLKAITVISIVTYTRKLQCFKWSNIYTYHAKRTNFKRSFLRDNSSKTFQIKVKSQQQEAVRERFLKIERVNEIKKIPRNKAYFVRLDSWNWITLEYYK